MEFVILCFASILFIIHGVIFGLSLGELMTAEEETVLDTRKEVTLQWVSTPPNAWKESGFPLESDKNHQVYHACHVNWNSYPIWLRTQKISRGEAKQLFMDVYFAQEACPINCNFTFNVYRQVELYAGHFIPDTRSLVKQISAERHFPPEALKNVVNFEKIRKELNSILDVSLGFPSESSFYLEFEYTGPCIFISSVRVFYKKCQAMIHNLAEFPVTPGGFDAVRGQCVQNAVAEADVVQQCQENGTWILSNGGCVCLPGFEEKGTACKECKLGYFKNSSGNKACDKCPPYSTTERESSTSCQCWKEYYRKETDPIEMGCTKPPSEPQNITYNYNDSTITLSWDAPTDTGGRADIQYRIICSILQKTEWEQCGDMQKIPDEEWLTETWVILDGLFSHSLYRIEIEAANGVSHLQDPPQKHASTLILHTKEIRQPATSLTTVQFFTHAETSQSVKIFAAIFTGVLVLVILLLIAAYTHRKKIKFRDRLAPMSQLLPVNPVVTYRRVEESRLQNLMISDSLKKKLKEVIVKRNMLSLGRELGSGEFGSVYEGLLQANNTYLEVAVKTMKVGTYTQADLDAFLKEAELMKHFNHPNVLSLLGISVENHPDHQIPIPMVILPFMKHGDLRTFLIATRHGEISMSIPVQTLIRFMIDIASGMEYLHVKGFLHRDLAARNCMLQDDLRVCVADFGLSKKIYSSNYYRQKAVIRMPVKWMALESMAESVYTTKSDVWSFGVTMWEIMSLGMTPYPGISNHEMYDYLQEGNRLKKPPDCPDKLYNAMNSCWLVDPNERHHFSELKSSLQEIHSSLPSVQDEEETMYINQGLYNVAQGVNTCADQNETRRNVYCSEPARSMRNYETLHSDNTPMSNN